MSTPRAHLIRCLRDAYAMEKHSETMLGAQACRLGDDAHLRIHIQHHLHETLGQQAMLASCLARLGSGPSLIKGMAGEITAFSQVVIGMTMRDEVVKGAMSTYAFEHAEIAAYTALVSVARAAGDLETTRICERILQQEVEMAGWLSRHIPATVTRYLMGVARKRDEATR
ncbi:ferritin-like domain-containing protein [Paraburkholderia strydomiana]|uniref:ferritin-like domain-containing protein n=1 Tax=Paraburkholderia strydomiana TaxID=1245417 RepID=UPI001BE75A77|nr:ferritin-like domain-containing protein [Paraburkholderia strydomiana]MBT2792947.1 ferritin-like domain-containing protein [Paraburkholderia strydomiana]